MLDDNEQLSIKNIKEKLNEIKSQNLDFEIKQRKILEYLNAFNLDIKSLGPLFKKTLIIIEPLFMNKFVSDNRDRITNEMVLTAIKQDPSYIQYAEPNIIEDAIKLNPDCLKFINIDLQSTNLVLAAVIKNGLALKFASIGFKSNKQIVLPAVTQNGLALQHANLDLRDNDAIVRAASKQNATAFFYASERLKNDATFILTLDYDYPYDLISYISDDLKADQAFIIKAIERNPFSLLYPPLFIGIEQYQIFAIKCLNKNPIEKNILKTFDYLLRLCLQAIYLDKMSLYFFPRMYLLTSDAQNKYKILKDISESPLGICKWDMVQDNSDINKVVLLITITYNESIKLISFHHAFYGTYYGDLNISEITSNDINQMTLNDLAHHIKQYLVNIPNKFICFVYGENKYDIFDMYKKINTVLAFQ